MTTTTLTKNGREPRTAEADAPRSPRSGDEPRLASAGPVLPLTRLNLGSGDCPLEGYENLDAKNGNSVYPLTDLDDDSVDEIRASHVLEHFSHTETLYVLREWYRVLRPGGVIRVAVPDFDIIVRSYLHSPGGSPIEGFLMGGHVDQHDHHGAIFSRGKLTQLMRMAGFVRPRRWQSDVNDCAALKVSLNVEMEKPQEPIDLERISRDCQMIMSMPRLAFSENMFCAIGIAAKLGVSIRKSHGVFWHQTMTQMMEEAIREGRKYVITCDYDSVFTHEDLIQLYRLMEENPDMNAVCAVQIRRAADNVLLTMKDDAGNFCESVTADRVLNEELLPISSGHFGLTLIRTEAIEQLERPWFNARPDAEGSWGAKRVDADVDFWLKMNEVYQANWVSIGHLQQVVSWPSKQFTAIHQYLPDYHKSGPPAGVL